MLRLFLGPLQEDFAGGDRRDRRRDPVVVLFQRAARRQHGVEVAGLELPRQGVDDQVLGEVPDEGPPPMFLEQVLLQILQSANEGAVRQRVRVFHRLPAAASDGVELLQGQPQWIDAVVATGATRVLPVRRHHFTQAHLGRVPVLRVLQLARLHRRRQRGRAQDLIQDVGTALDGAAAVRMGGEAQDARHAQQAAAAVALGQRDLPESVAFDPLHAVEVGELAR